MAMIKCPKCGEMISDKATKCVHCGFDLVTKPKIFCKECGAELEDGTTVCGNCGCPVEDEATKDDSLKTMPNTETKENSEPSATITVQSKNEETVNNKKKSKKLTGIIIGVVVVLVIGLISVQMKKQAEIKAQKEAEAAAAAAEEQYGKDIKNLNDTLLIATARAEKCGNKIHDVWYNTIWKKDDTETDEFTKDSVTGSFNSDFNTSLKNLFSDQDFKKTEKAVSNDMAEITESMKALKDPPEKWADAYNAIQNFYNDYIKFENLVTSPSGSLTSYSQQFNQIDQDAVSDYSKMKLYIE
jgi:type II secretory pathway pseudopilin PulG